MENNISNSDKTDEVHIEEYDITDSFDGDEIEFDDVESEAPEDVDLDDEIDEEVASPGIKEEKSKKSISVLIGEKMPALANIFKRKKKEIIESEAAEGTDPKETDDESKPKPKFKLTPIHIVVIIGLIIFMFVGDEEPVETAKPLKPIQKVIPKKKIEKPVVAEEVKPTEVVDEMAEIRMENTPDQSVVEKPVVDNNPVEQPKIETPEDEPTTVMDDVELDIDKEPRRIEDPVIAEEVPSNSDMDSDSNSDSDDEDSSDEVNEVVNETELDTKTETEITESTVSEIPVTPEEIVPQEIIDPEMSTDMTKKLLENLQVKLKEERVVQKDTEPLRPMSAPSYEAAGSGLVYNCKGGHWACIEADEFKKCRQNYGWNKSESIPIECYPLAFLDSDFDCGTVQQEKVNAVPDLNFCQ